MGTFAAKERVLAAFAHQTTDRVPVDYHANPGIDARLKAHFGLGPKDHDGLKRALGVDFAYAYPGYHGPRLHADVPGRQVDIWGVRTRYVEHESGGYWDFCDFPLRDATVEEALAWPLPKPDDFGYEQARRQAVANAGYCVGAGGAGLGCIINRIGKWRGMDQVLMDLATADPVAEILIRRKQEVELALAERLLEACRGVVDFLFIGEDLSTQNGPMISRELYRRAIKPWHARFAALGKAHGLPVMFHSCGSCSWVFDDLIEIGIDVVQTLQPEAAAMAPAYLKEHWGDRLAFHGCIPTGGVVAEGSPAAVTALCRETLAVMMPGGGYCFSPSHQLQDNTPTENALAIYEAARHYGAY